MRIRKNARAILAGGTSSSFLVCQLNRSPWDLVDVTSLQGDCFGVNTNERSYFADSIPASDSHGESMELSYEYVEKPPLLPPPKREREDEFTVVVENKPPTPAPLPPPGPKRRGRPRKHPFIVAVPPLEPDPNEFYYYSGFGPKWGKSKRGGDKNNYHNHHKTENVVIGVADNSQPSSSTTQMISEDENYHNKKKLSKKRNDNGVDLLDNVVDGELDYIEDDSDDNGHGSRRPRKPIKARSLKSLM